MSFEQSGLMIRTTAAVAVGLGLLAGCSSGGGQSNGHESCEIAFVTSGDTSAAVDVALSRIRDSVRDSKMDSSLYTTAEIKAEDLPPETEAVTVCAKVYTTKEGNRVMDITRVIGSPLLARARATTGQ